MDNKRYLIINADDFGRSPGVNRGIIQTHEHGIVTSASLMVRWPAAAEAAAYGRAHPSLSLGIHIDLGEWIYGEGTWVPLYEVVPVEDAAAVKGEVANQLTAFRRLTGKKPTHIDSHQHVHQKEPVRSVLIDLAHDMHVPLRQLSPEVHYCGSFYGQTAEGSPLPHLISVDGLIRLLTDLPPGVTELGCHPGFATDLDTTYQSERLDEVKVLCDQQVRAALIFMEIELCSFPSAAANGVDAKRSQTAGRSDT